MLNFDYLANVPKDPNFLKYYTELSLYNKNSNHQLGSYADQIYNSSTTKILSCFDNYKYVEYIPGGGAMANRRAFLGKISLRPMMIEGIRKDVILVSSIEHTSIINYTVPILLNNDYTVVVIQCKDNGIISVDNLIELLECYNKRIIMVSIMNVNNETGIIQDLSSYVKKVKKYNEKYNQNIIFHSDITQGLKIYWNKMKKKYQPDILTCSGYKLGGPHIGLVISKYKLSEDYTGTPDVTSIYTLANIITDKYTESKYIELNNTNTEIYIELKKYILENLTEWLNKNDIKYKLLSTIENSLNNVISLLLYGYQGRMIQEILSSDNICIGTGSACQSIKKNGSHVIRAMGYSTGVTFNLIRISWDKIIDKINSDKIIDKINSDKIIDKINSDKIIDKINSDKIIDKINSDKIIDKINSDKINSDILITKLCETINKMKSLVVRPNAILSSTKLKQIFEPIIKETKLSNNYSIKNYEYIKNIFIHKIKLSFSETWLKGNNKHKFIKSLKNDILGRLFNKENWNICENGGYILLSILDNYNKSENYDNKLKLIHDTIHHLKYIPGISLITPEYSIPSKNNQGTLDMLINSIAYLYSMNNNKSIAIRTSIKTDSKLFINYKSQELNVLLGKLLVDEFKAPVNLKNPDLEFRIRINPDCINISTEKYIGIPGLPLNSEGTIALILNDKNYLRSLIACMQLSTRGSKIICYSYISTNNFNDIIKRINPYINYKLIDPRNNIDQLLDIIKEKNVLFERHTKNLFSYINSLKKLGRKYDKYITCVTGHMSFNDILQYLCDIHLDYFRPLDDDEYLEMEDMDDNINNINGVISMISGGIDSPVSTKLIYDYCKNYQSKLNLIHFSSNINKIDVINNIRNKINNNKTNNKDNIDNNIKLFVVNFAKLQDEITKVCPKKYRTILYKIFMVHITNYIAIEQNLQCIIMGNSWGQVASQTCENIYITDKFSKLPIYNPLLGLPKTQIIKYAQQIDTYDDSICTGTNDCCIMYLPKHPVLKGEYDIINTYIEKFSNFLDYIEIIIQ